MENNNQNPAGELNTEGKTKGAKRPVAKVMDIQTFEDGVRKGLYSDDKGTAYLILNGTLFSSYNIYIDRRRITKAGAVVSFDGFLKNYTPDQIQICYEPKEPRLPSLNAYRESKTKKKK